MNRRTFLKGLGVLGIAALVPPLRKRVDLPIVSEPWYRKPNVFYSASIRVEQDTWLVSKLFADGEVIGTHRQWFPAGTWDRVYMGGYHPNPDAGFTVWVEDESRGKVLASFSFNDHVLRIDPIPGSDVPLYLDDLMIREETA